MTKQTVCNFDKRIIQQMIIIKHYSNQQSNSISSQILCISNAKQINKYMSKKHRQKRMKINILSKTFTKIIIKILIMSQKVIQKHQQNLNKMSKLLSKNEIIK